MIKIAILITIKKEKENTMKKWTKMMTLYSVAVLASASSLTAFADENVPVTTDIPAVAVAPAIDNSESTTTPSDDTTVPTVPTDPVATPTEPTDTTGGDVVTPTDPNVTVPTEPTPTEPTVTQPSDTTVTPTDGTTEPTTPTEPTEPSSDGDGTVTVPTVNGGTTTLTPNPSVPTNNPAVSAQTAVNAGASQVGTTSTVTGQVVSNVTPSAPVYTNTGYQIVSTQNGQVVLSDGSTVAPEAIGAVTNTDKTITVTKADGTKATLPETGEAASFLAVVGTGLLGLVGFLFKKKLV